jgi:hypothetical protein
MSEHGKHTRSIFCSLSIDGNDSSFGDTASDKDRVRDIGDELIRGIGCPSSNLEPSIDTIYRLTHDIRHVAFLSALDRVRKRAHDSAVRELHLKVVIPVRFCTAHQNISGLTITVLIGRFTNEYVLCL